MAGFIENFFEKLKKNFYLKLYLSPRKYWILVSFDHKLLFIIHRLIVYELNGLFYILDILLWCLDKARVLYTHLLTIIYFIQHAEVHLTLLLLIKTKIKHCTVIISFPCICIMNDCI